MNRMYSAFVRSIRCLSAAALTLVLLTGCGNITPDVPNPENKPDEVIYQEAVALAEAGWNWSSSQKFDSIRGYRDAGEKADHHMREHVRWALEKGYYDEVYIAAKELEPYDYADRNLIFSCADHIYYQSGEDDLFYASYILDLIGESDRIYELEKQKEQAEQEALQAEYDRILRDAIRLYRAGRYEDAEFYLCQIPYRHSLLSQMYSGLCDLQYIDYTDEIPTFSTNWIPEEFEDYSPLMDILCECVSTPEYADYHEDAAEALAHPEFDLLRFFGSDWKCGSYYINTWYDTTGEADATVEHNLPQDYFPEVERYALDPANDLVYLCNKNSGEVFRVLGFSSDDPHPDEMYVLDYYDNRLTFTAVRE